MKRRLFFHKCLDAGNSEALYRKGLVDYLEGKGAEDDALGCLKKAASAGHIASQYAVCIILIFLGGEHKENGIRMLIEMISKESREGIRTAREKLVNIINLTWLCNFSFATKPVCCTKHYGRVKKSWEAIDSDDDEDSSMGCKFCKCDKKFLTFLNLGQNS
nr:putative F-box protein At1g67623 [Ipomoea batatas]GMC65790.1 putative F-box protein At1g67623 [Ipomoea batatas]GMD34879.1 putative F-box protein At1g67623 [Ipomoea batatas]